MYQFYQNQNPFSGDEGSIRSRGEPFLEIVEQPQSRGFRFRYECEGPTHGGLRGEKNTKNKKTYPEIRIRNYKGPARIMISLVTDEPNPKDHVHKLIGNKCKNGIYVLEMPSEQMTAQIQDLVILHATKKKTADILFERLMESMRAEKVLTTGDNSLDLTKDEQEHARKQADEQAKVMQLNVVRLCFQAYLLDTNGQYTRVLSPVYTMPIYDSKSPGAAALKICRMDRHAGSCTGGEEIFLLCDKVQKDDIAVRFYQLDENGDLQWEGYGDFGPSDVHRQFAIVFRTPKYPTAISEPVRVELQLKRLKDGEASDPMPFTYYPQTQDQEDIEKKKRKRLQGFDDNLYGSPGAGTSMGGGGGGYFDGGGDSLLPTVIPDNFGDSSSHGLDRCYQPDVVQTSAMQLQSGVYRMRGMPNIRPVTLNEGPASLPAKKDDSVTLRAKVEAKESSRVSRSVIHTDCAVSIIQQTSRYDSGVGDDVIHLSVEDSSHHQPESLPITEVTTKHSHKPTDLTTGMSNLSLKEPTSATAVTSSSSSSKTSPPVDVVKRDLQYTQSIAERMLKAAWLYAATGNAAFLLMVQRHLLKLQNSDGDSVLHESIIYGQVQALKDFLAVLDTMTDKTTFAQMNNLKQTPLHLAAATDGAEMVRLLLQYGCPLSAVDRHGNTALHIAARDGFISSLEALVEADSDALALSINKANFDGCTPLHLAVMNERVECVQLLVAYGADKNAEHTLTGRRPLHLAAATGNLVIISHLRGASVNSPSFDGNTPLHVAVSQYKINVAALLMSMGADPDIENRALVDSDGEDDSASDDEEEEEEEEEEMEFGSETRRGLSGNDNTSLIDQRRVADKPRYLRGFTPRMMARSSLPMSRVLRGEVEPSVITGARSDRSQNIIALHNIKGDMFLLQEKVRRSLASALDKNQAWHRLAQLLKLDSLMASYEADDSPTYKLFGDYQSLNGTVDRLRKCLKDMRRDDCVQLVDSALGQ